MSFFSFSKLVRLVLLASSALGLAFNPRRFSLVTWNPSGENVGLRVFGTAPDRRGFLELNTQNKGLQNPLWWYASMRLFGTVTTAEESDFAAISSRDGQQIIVFFVRDDGALVYGQWTDATADMWALKTVGGGAAPAANSSLGAAMWAAGHMSVFYQDGSGSIFESEFANGTWARPRAVATASLGTDINAVAASNANGMLKAVYVQGGASIIEWLSSASSGWSNTTITPSPEISATSRFSVSSGRIHYTSADGGLAEITGRVGLWRPRGGKLSVSNNGPATDVASGLLLFDWVFVFYSTADNTLWNQVSFAFYGWQRPQAFWPSGVPWT
ncbi:hypothetical protein EXIGLDRAFT_760168 [Exidia glandulosa HHB12029]|uniref:Fucose-specific lectin n=1 Tax=Exidia glandulosa HHB12029 TaxID=1314781 RepID=A0A165PBG4_EXIGL|nr:hypothetical protein EXIGLDRAFT_760168 [Exidia glandulosa HHB12029]